MSRCNFQVRGPVLAALVALLLASAALGQEAIVSARSVGITDGDAVKALVAGNELLRVRLSWIDAPEKSQAFGQEAPSRHTGELQARLKHGGSNADAGVSGIPFRRGNIGALPSKQIDHVWLNS
jgi:endonuclease YncB( thermonuclease family)